MQMFVDLLALLLAILNLEFVDINDKGEIVVSLQENNHMVVLDSSGNVISDFSAWHP